MTHPLFRRWRSRSSDSGERKQRPESEEDLLSMSQEDLILNGSFSFTALLQSDIIYKVHSVNGQANTNHEEEENYSKQADTAYSSGNANVHSANGGTTQKTVEDSNNKTDNRYNTSTHSKTCEEMENKVTPSEEGAIEHNPWRADLFGDMMLEQVSVDDDPSSAATKENNTCQNNEDTERPESEHPHEEDDNECLDEEDIERFLQNEEEAAASEGNLMNTSSNFKPQLGLQFKTKEEG